MLSTQQGPAAVPAVLAQLVEQARSLATAEARQLLTSSTPAERAGRVVGLQQLTDAVAAATLTAVEVFDANGDGQTLHGAASTQAWLRGACRVPGHRRRSRRAGPARPRLPRTARRPRRTSPGRVLTYQHLRALDRGTRHLPPPQQPQAVALLTDLATVAPVPDVRTASKHLAHVLDPDGSLTDNQHQFDRQASRVWS